MRKIRFLAKLAALLLFTSLCAGSPIDVLIPSTEKDLETLDLCIEHVKKNIQDVRRIIVISKKRLTKKAEWHPEEDYPISFDEVREWLPESAAQRTGWYFQQLLKIYAPDAIPNLSENFLCIDSDTFFFKKTGFISAKGKALHTVGKNPHPPYFAHLHRLLPALKNVDESLSGIAHHMLFNKRILKQIRETVEEEHRLPFWQAFLACVDPLEARDSGASEYEIYFHYCRELCPQTTTRRLYWANVADLKRLDHFKAQGFHYVSCHSYKRKP
ncbi:MAG: hypothetical protein KDK48_00880 [Chlamydiia bacterium]|nr:hypothetical protein [Chlamydiia bacterium]